MDMYECTNGLGQKRGGKKIKEKNTTILFTLMPYRIACQNFSLSGSSTNTATTKVVKNMRPRQNERKRIVRGGVVAVLVIQCMNITWLHSLYYFYVLQENIQKSSHKRRA